MANVVRQLFPRGDAWEGKPIDDFSDALQALVERFSKDVNGIRLKALPRAFVIQSRDDIHKLAKKQGITINIRTGYRKTRCGTLRAGMSTVTPLDLNDLPIEVVGGNGLADKFYSELLRWLPAQYTPKFRDLRMQATSAIANIIVPIAEQHGFRAYVRTYPAFTAGSKAGQHTGGKTWNNAFQVIFINGNGRLDAVREAIELAVQASRQSTGQQKVQLFFKDAR